MNISYSWLKEYVSFDLSPEKVAEILTFIGLEVEEMDIIEDVPGGLAGVVVAEVLECIPHPDSDHLHITKVSIGAGDPLQIVCGAPNVAAGQKVLLATVGAVLHPVSGEEFKIKKSKIRGAESLGMICAEDELGIGTSHEGIMVLDPDAVPGTSAKDYLHLGGDTVFTIGLTPNRIDAFSHIGVARDFAAYLRLNHLGGELTIPSVAAFKEGAGDAVPVKVLSAARCPRYMGITMKNVKIAPSPEWLQKKMHSIGIRPINNVVDITNFILHEVGQPLHAFDADKIKGRQVIVRQSEPGYKFVTLDGVEHELSDEDMMICNASEPMCIAGVFGGLESGITEQTTSVFIESAYFNPSSIRKTARRHGLSTDASFLYERGADPQVVPFAAKRAALLIQELAGGQVVGKIQEHYPQTIDKKRVALDYDRMEALIGKKIGHKTISDILHYMDFEFLSEDENQAVVLVPTYRVDVYRECDVVEEVLRIYGYNNIELPQHVKVSINPTVHPDPEKVKETACNLLADNGFMECMNNSLTKADYYEHIKTYPKDNLVMILNPLSSDLNAMRQNLLFGGLEVVEYNLNRQSSDLKLFEMGNVYSHNPSKGDISALESYHEEMHLVMLMTGKGSQYWRNSSGEGHYFALKGYMELLFKRFGLDVNNMELSAAPADLYAEGLEYLVNGKSLAVMGTVSAERLKQFGIKMPVFAAEISWNYFLDLYKRNKVKYKELPKFPEVRRDLALLVDENASYAQLRKAAFAAERKVLKNVSLFDVYRGDKIPEGKKQYALSFTLQDPDKTLTDQFVEQVIARLLNAFKQQFGAELR